MRGSSRRSWQRRSGYGSSRRLSIRGSLTRGRSGRGLRGRGSSSTERIGRGSKRREFRRSRRSMTGR
jgi:hypothetical protein